MATTFSQRRESNNNSNKTTKKVHFEPNAFHLNGFWWPIRSFDLIYSFAGQCSHTDTHTKWIFCCCSYERVRALARAAFAVPKYHKSTGQIAVDYGNVFSLFACVFCCCFVQLGAIRRCVVVDGDEDGMMDSWIDKCAETQLWRERKIKINWIWISEKTNQWTEINNFASTSEMKKGMGNENGRIGRKSLDVRVNGVRACTLARRDIWTHLREK